jgi:hypothetical protein
MSQMNGRRRTTLEPLSSSTMNFRSSMGMPGRAGPGPRGSIGQGYAGDGIKRAQQVSQAGPFGSFNSGISDRSVAHWTRHPQCIESPTSHDDQRETMR